jgi:hypothetical protein
MHDASESTKRRVGYHPTFILEHNYEVQVVQLSYLYFRHPIPIDVRETRRCRHPP